MPFLTLVGIRHTFDRNDWTVIEEVAFKSDRLNRVLRGPVGMHTNLASVPRLVWWLIPPMDKHIVDGAVIHDYLYQSNGLLVDTPVVTMTRKQCDQFLRDAVIAQRAPVWYKTVVYAGVRLGGWWPWWKYKRASKAAKP